MPGDDEWERQEQEKWLRADREAQEIEAGDFICPWYQRYVDPAEWWTYITGNPYEDVDSLSLAALHPRVESGCLTKIHPCSDDLGPFLR